MDKIITSIQTAAIILLFLLGLGIGAVAGHFHGKAETLDKFVLATASMMK